MNWPTPTRQDHERFCRTEGWTVVRDAQERTGTHHVTYELVLKDGTILRTRISHPPDRSSYGAGLWAHVLRDQLQVSEAEFWACVREGERPRRGEPEQPRESLPADLVYLLITRVGLDESAIALMTKEQAVARLQRFWTESS